jgi:hopanoid biosynthesis associated protein HpnK
LKRLIINADDFGFTRDVNAGIVHAHREGVLTSTTLMATGEAFEDAVHLARETPSLDVGCHLVLIQGHALTTGQRFPDTPREVVTGLFKLRGRLDVYEELRAQIRKIIAAGIRPTHLDSHKHSHIFPTIFRIVVRLAQEFGIPYVRLPLDTTTPYGAIPCALLDPLYRRMARNRKVLMTDHFLGFRLTGSFDEDSFKAALAILQEGTTEFMCHPGFLGEELRGAVTRLKESRVRELEALTSPRIREFMDAIGVRLATFGAADRV